MQRCAERKERARIRKLLAEPIPAKETIEQVDLAIHVVVLVAFALSMLTLNLIDGL
jgi:hypothetical protein